MESGGLRLRLGNPAQVVRVRAKTSGIPRRSNGGAHLINGPGLATTHRMRSGLWLAALASATSMIVVSCSTDAPLASVSPVADGGSDAGAILGQPAGWDDDVRSPVLEDANPAPDVVEVTLEAKLAPIVVAPGAAPITMWTYNGVVAGPTLRAKRGDRVIVHFRNSLPEPTTIHWHGVRVPNAMDGMPSVQSPVLPGATFDYVFDVPDAGTFWYHPHVHSGVQVGYGLYGAIVIADPSSPVSADDLVLVLSDATVTDAGVLEPPDATGAFSDYFGREGNVVLVNGKTRPLLRARSGLPQRWRIINASRAHYAELSIPGFAITRLGGDVGFAAAARPIASEEGVLLVPGERVELFVVPRGVEGTRTSLVWSSYDRFHVQASTRSASVVDIELAGAPVAGRDALPAKLGNVVAIEAAPSLVKRTIAFTDTGTFGINGKVGADVPMFDVPAGTTQVWTIQNNTSQDHPFHLHGFAFQVVARGASPPADLEMRDTVNVVARQSIQIVVPFDDRKGTWMYHCHILDHADAGMFGMFMVM
jgi:FtsP/CotA-like multicopper oxidase with cupredoxin domain